VVSVSGQADQAVLAVSGDFRVGQNRFRPVRGYFNEAVSIGNGGVFDVFRADDLVVCGCRLAQ
jgi:hypothetical protein